MKLFKKLDLLNVPIVFCAVVNAAVAMLHISNTFSPGMIKYFKFPNWTQNNSIQIIIYSLIMAIIFLVFAFYTWKVLDEDNRPPFLRSILLLIGAIYLIRGLLFFVEVIIKLRTASLHYNIPTFELIISAVALVIGVFYFESTISNWKSLVKLNSKLPE
jgi:uncharacterized protein YacL